MPSSSCFCRIKQARAQGGGLREPDPLLSRLHITDMCAHFSHSLQWGLGRYCLHSQSLLSGLSSLSQPTSARPLPGCMAAGAWCGPEHHQAELAPSHCGVSESRALGSGAKHIPRAPTVCEGPLPGTLTQGGPGKDPSVCPLPLEWLILIDVGCSLWGSPVPYRRT